MKKIFLSALLISAIILTGCNTKNSVPLESVQISDKKQELPVFPKQEQIKEMKAIYNESVFFSQSPLNDLIAVNKAEIAGEIFLQYIYSNNQGSYGEDFLWNAKYDETTKTFYVNNLSLAGVVSEEETCIKNLGYYKIPVEKIDDDDFDLFDYRVTNFCMDDSEEPLEIENKTSNEGVHLSKDFKGKTLIKKDENGKELAKIYFDEERKILSVYNSALKEPYFYVEKLPQKEIYKDLKGNILKIYKAEFKESENEKILNKINVFDKNDNLIETYIFNLKDIN